jgi:hypothetical protein
MKYKQKQENTYLPDWLLPLPMNGQGTVEKVAAYTASSSVSVAAETSGSYEKGGVDE